MASPDKPVIDEKWFRERGVEVSSDSTASGVQFTDKRSGVTGVVPEATARQMDPDKYDFVYVMKGKPVQIMQLSPEQKMVQARRFGQAAIGIGASFIPGLNVASGPLLAQRVAPLVSALLRGGVAASAGGLTDAGFDAAAGMPVNPETVGSAAQHQFIDSMLGSGLDYVAPKLATMSMTKALRPNQSMLEKRPTLIKDALELRTQVRNAGAIPVEAMRAGQAARADLNGMIRDGQQAGLYIPPNDFMDGLDQLRRKIDAEDATGEKLQALDEFIAEFKRRNGMGLDIETAQARKRGTQANAKTVFKAEKAGASGDLATNTRARANRAVARDLRTAINDALENAGITGLATGRSANQLNADIQKARAVSDATRRAQNIQPSRLENLMGALGGGFSAHLAAPDGLTGAAATGAGFVLGQLMNNPKAYSRYALLLSDPRFVGLVRAAPSALDNALIDYTGFDRPRQGNPWR